MEKHAYDDARLEELLRKGQASLRKARVAIAVPAIAILAHLEYLLLPVARSLDGLRAILIMGYPVLLAMLAVGPLLGLGGRLPDSPERWPEGKHRAE